MKVQEPARINKASRNMRQDCLRASDCPDQKIELEIPSCNTEKNKKI